MQTMSGIRADTSISALRNTKDRLQSGITLNNLFSHRFNIEFNKGKHDYNTGSKNNNRKSASSRNWGHWSSTNFASNDWNKLDLSIRQSPSLASLDNIIVLTPRDAEDYGVYVCHATNSFGSTAYKITVSEGRKSSAWTGTIIKWESWRKT